jgi:hypothetical protein
VTQVPGRTRPFLNSSCRASPGFRPRKPNSGIGVERSLPRDLENSRNAAVMTAQTVWLPMSSRPVSQQPSRKNPVMGFIEQTSSHSASTLRGGLNACRAPSVLSEAGQHRRARGAPPSMETTRPFKVRNERPWEFSIALRTGGT